MKVSDYIECIHVVKGQFESEIDRSLSLVSIFYDTPFEQAELLTMQDVKKKMEAVNGFLNKEFQEVSNIKLPNQTILTAVPDNLVTLGNFIDLEAYLHNTDDLAKGCAIIYRKAKKNKWGHIEFEPVDFDLQERESLLMNVEASNVIGRVKSYTDFRNRVTNEYKAIFGLDEEEQPEPVNLDELTPIERKEAIEEEKKKQLQSQYSWESFVYWLADNRITDVEKVLNFPVMYALNMASMRKVYENG